MYLALSQNGDTPICGNKTMLVSAQKPPAVGTVLYRTSLGNGNTHAHPGTALKPGSLDGLSKHLKDIFQNPRVFLSGDPQVEIS